MCSLRVCRKGIALPKEKLVDTNGKGDAYVGDCWSCLVQEKSGAYSGAACTYVASAIVQTSGCADFMYQRVVAYGTQVREECPARTSVE